MKRFLAAFVVMASGLASPAIAADEVMMNEVAPERFNWSGFYAGVAAGYGWGDVHAEDLDNYNGLEEFSYDVDGFVGNLFAGYNYQFKNGIVAGAEAEFGYLGIDGDRQSPIQVGLGSPRDDSLYSTDGGIYGALYGRLGYGFDRIHIFAKGGIVAADIDQGFKDTDTTVGGGFISPVDENVDLGYAVGGGVEFAVTPSIIARIEGQYYNFGSTTVTGTNAGIPSRFKQDLEFGVVKAGVSFKF